MLENFIKNTFKDFVAEGVKILKEDVFSVLPDVVGYTAMLCGAFIILSPLLNRNIMRPLGIFAAVGIVCASILGAM